MLCFRLMCVAQALTVAITGPAWVYRCSDHPWPSLPVLDGLATIEFVAPMIASALAAIRFPRVGAVTHSVTLAVAILADEMRLQPHLIWMAAVMFSEAFRLRRLTWAVFASLWLWSGLHKVISPEWPAVCDVLMDRLDWGLPAWAARVFEAGVMWSEVGLGVLCLVRPWWARWPGLALHAGIIIFLGCIGWNPAVSVWNAAAGVGCLYGLRGRCEYDRESSRRRWEWLAAAIVVAWPATYYWGWCHSHLAIMLYCEGMPKAMASNGPDRDWRIIRTDDLSIGSIAVPFPDGHREFVRWFEVKEKFEWLHISDPRLLVDDRFFRLREGIAQEISRQRFGGRLCPDLWR